MSRIQEISTLSCRSISDLLYGTAISAGVDSVFGHIDISKSGLLKKGVVVIAQTLITVLLSNEIRTLVYDAQSPDLTGGLVFIASVFRQPNFWKRVDDFYTNLLLEFAQLLFENPSDMKPPAPAVPPSSSSP